MQTNAINHQDLAELHAAVAAADRNAVRFLTRRLKGGSSIFGACARAAVCDARMRTADLTT